MNTTGNLTGTAFTSDEDCAALTGRVVHEYVTKLGITQDGYVIARVVRYIDIGRADAITPADIDAQLKPERFPERESQRELAAQRARSVLMQNTIERHAAIQATLTAYMLEHGPSSIVELAAGTGLNRSTVGPHLSQRHNTIYEKLYAPGNRYKVWNVISKAEEER